MTPEEILAKGKALMKTKSADYAATSNRYQNYERNAELSSWFNDEQDKVFAGIMGQKLARLATMLNKGGLPNHESIEDTFVDLVNTAANWAGWRSQ